MADGAHQEKPISLFYSYSHRDEELRKQLDDHLAGLRRSGMIDEWHDRNIDVGDEWAEEIDRNLSSADIILLLVSASFIASEYCWSVEMKKALERHSKGEAKVIPVILRPCSWHMTPFAKLQAAPTDATPVASWSDHDLALYDVACKIEHAVTDLQQRRRAAEQIERKAKEARKRAETEALIDMSEQAETPAPELGQWRRLPRRERQWKEQPEPAESILEPPHTAPLAPVVFITYCHEDRHWLDELRPHLQILEEELGVRFWDDTKMPPEVTRLQFITRCINSSAIIICLLSNAYLTSNNFELPIIYDANTKGALLLPIYITQVSLNHNHWFSQLHGVNSPKQPLVTMNEGELDNLYSKIVEFLRVALTEKLQTPTPLDQGLLEEEASLMSDFEKVQEHRAAESVRYNIAVIGRTGVGKSELINYLFGKQVAKSGIGTPVTKRGFTRHNFDVQGISGTLFDSWGLEVDKSAEWIIDLKDEMCRRGSDKPVEDWFHTIFVCIDACSARIQEFEISIITQFMNERYRVVVIFTKSDLASERTINDLKAVIERAFGAAVPSIPVCSVLSIGHTIPFGATQVLSQIYEGFWFSIIQRLPARCVKLMCIEVDKWRGWIVDYVEKRTGRFNHKEIINYVDCNAQTFVNNMRETRAAGIVESEAKKTIAVFDRCAQLLNYSACKMHDIQLQSNLSIQEAAVEPKTVLTAGLSGLASYATMGALISTIGAWIPIGVISIGLPVIPIIGGAVYLAGIKAKFKHEIITKIEDFAERVKRELEASESQIEDSLKKMLWRERVCAFPLSN